MSTDSGTMSGPKSGVANLEALDGAQNRDRQRNHAVTGEQRGADDPEGDQNRRARGEAVPVCCTGARGSSAVRARMPPSP